MHKEKEEIPVLFFLLEYHKYHEILKIMQSKELSKSVLDEYGHQQPSPFSEYEEYKIQNSISKFTLSQLLQIKGSSETRPKLYENRFLIEIMKRKIITENVNSDVRKKLWTQFTELYQKNNLYASLTSLQIAPDFEEIIDKDLHRTKTTFEIKRKAKQVLMNFAQYNPYIGYCQGMNHIITFFLEENFNCEQTFFIFKKITDVILPCEYYSQMNSVVAYVKIFFQLLNFTHPKIYEKMKEILQQIGGSFMIVMTSVFQWFVCLFMNPEFNKRMTRIIIDYFLLEGITAFFKAGLAIFQFLEEDIINVKSFEQYALVQKKIKKTENIKMLKNWLDNKYLSNVILDLLKEKCQCKNRKYIEKMNEVKKQQKKTNHKIYQKKCNPKWTACMQLIESNFQKNYSYEFFVFKTGQDVKIQQNYLQKVNRKYFNKTKPVKQSDSLVIGRMQHICRPQTETITEDSISEERQREEGNQEWRTPIKSMVLKDSLKGEIEINEDSERKIRKKIKYEIDENFQKKIGLIRSDSISFMKEMIENESIHNLLELYEIDELFQ